jgi:anti-sigma-K factor RskA
MTCEEFEQLSGAYALDAITPAERQAAEEHLADCAKCSHLAQELRAVVALLPLSIRQINPSPMLKERILASLPEKGTPAHLSPVPIGPAARHRRRGVGIVIAAALMFSLLAGMTAWNISLNKQVSVLQEQLSQLTRALPISYQVKGTSIEVGVMGQLLYYPGQNITVLTVSGLPQPRGSHVYQGWLLQTKGKVVTSARSIGLLNTENGSASLSFQGNVTGYNATAISLEAGPSPTPDAPKGEVVAMGSLKRS